MCHLTNHFDTSSHLTPISEGRIHRLGQDKPCHVVKFAFNNSFESNVLALHRGIAAGRVSIVDGFVPPAAMRILRKDLRIKDPYVSQYDSDSE